MNTENNTYFFNELEIQRFVPQTLFFDENSFTSLPNDWFILYTDIVKSTELCNEGKHGLVSKIAAAGIDIIIKSGAEKNIEMPYVYGGDGIFAGFPEEIFTDIKEECIKLSVFAKEMHGIEIRICIIPVTDIFDQDLSIGVKRVSLSRGLVHTLFDDRAFSWIEDECKKGVRYTILEEKKKEEDILSLPTEEPSYVLPLWEKVSHLILMKIFFVL